ncbi:acyl-CoA dehydrogenase family protein [Singulisphaera sp. Ch08]|uniref:Acyl-CoA dehydrogenase family protein n=1 Tax=Singulisphaera sp. Ch08 TaxID=3120278 RepID=A0AAU7CER6_9BACT
MNFSLSAEQQDWQDRAIAFAKENLVDDLLGRDERREFWREGWRRCASFGIQGLPIPAEYGGKGQDLQATIAAMEGLGYGCADNGLIFAINASMWTNSIPILRYGTEAQKQQFLPGLCDGTFVGANGASEVDAGSDIFSMQTRAERRGDRWILNGRKTWVTSGPVADLFVCYATSAPERGVMGISAFIIPRETPGFRVVREIPKLGVRTVPMGELALEDCELPGESLLGREGRGAEVFNCSMEWERGAILASALGTMKRQLERCITHVRTRKQFGKPIGKNQSVANKIVDMAVRLETCRPLVYRIGWLKAQGKDATLEAAMAKLHVSDCFVKNSLDAVQLFGAAGFVSETGIEKDLRDSIGSTIYSGTNEIQRNVIAQHLIR